MKPVRYPYASNLEPFTTVKATFIAEADNGEVICTLGAGAIPFQVRLLPGAAAPQPHTVVFVSLARSLFGSVVPVQAMPCASNDSRFAVPA